MAVFVDDFRMNNNTSSTSWIRKKLLIFVSESYPSFTLHRPNLVLVVIEVERPIHEQQLESSEEALAHEQVNAHVQQESVEHANHHSLSPRVRLRNPGQPCVEEEHAVEEDLRLTHCLALPRQEPIPECGFRSP